jgi:hypothetical protein
VEDGKNPDSISKQQFEQAITRNQSTNAKILALEHLKETVEKEVKRVMPQDYDIYEQAMK